jgi:CheY-like chemotaxis protein
MSKSVLYIEDSLDNIRLVERLVVLRTDTTLHVATNAVDGNARAVEVQPDLILLDNRLPDATGAEVLRLLAASSMTAGLPVVIVTGDSGRETVDQLVALGAREVLEKPFAIDEFYAVLDRYLLDGGR